MSLLLFFRAASAAIEHAGQAVLTTTATLRAAPTIDLDPYRDLILASGPIGYWRLADSGTLTNKALRVGGSNQRLQLGDVSVTGDLEIVARLALDNYAQGNSVLWAKDQNGSRDWQANVGAPGAGRIRFHWWNSAGTLASLDYGTALSTVMTNGQYYWLRLQFDVDNGAGGRTLTISYAADQETIPTSWTTLGTPVSSAGVTNIRDGTDAVAIGDTAWSVATPAYHKFFELRSGLNGTSVARFDASVVDMTTTAAPITTVQLGGTWTLTGGAIWSFTTNAGTGVAKDFSPNALNGTYVAGPTQVSGAIRNNGNMGTVFNGTTQYVDLGSSALLNPTQTTVEAWFKTTSTANMTIYRWRLSGVDLRITNGALQVQIYVNADGISTAAGMVQAPGRWNDGKWHHVVYTFDTITQRLYVDGTQRITSAFGTIDGVQSTFSLFYDTGASNGVAIGRDGTNSASYWNGAIDEVAVYNTALSAAAVQERFRRGVFQSGWSYITNLPVAVYLNSVAVLDGVFYSIAGYTGAYHSGVYAYDVATQTWTAKASALVPSYQGAACVLGGKLYYSGGYYSGARAEFSEYNPATNSWVYRAVMPQGMYSHSMAPSTAQNRIYCFGGLTNALEYNPTTNTWTTFAMATPRFNNGATEYSNGKIYIAGGDGSTVTQEFDPVTGTFTTKQAMPIRHAGFHLVSFSGKLWAAGGNASDFKNVQAYDPVTNTWESKEPMVAGRQNAPSGALADRIIVAGGYVDGGIVNSAEQYLMPATAAAATIPMTMLFSPYPKAEATLSMPLPLTGGPVEIEGTRVPKPGMVRTGWV